MACVEDMR
ncbi:Protein of unknown function [Propionibacterium freudenreichii]|nr:Protein of unknown function [Propionibacterium freudenreichii subsp. freudenreichii]CEG85626.1 Protein of unknown function [Propionibacterium freudenreichii]CEG88620.1 Protein of unknown function [Propionibacterium freudenreichii]CEG92798.1 Protein of unknown function [Propionibacterium freudenreichii]CEG96386.1 Protein of unknown function [Propionibacterium freudenreichii]